MGRLDLLFFVVITSFGLPMVAKAGEEGPVGVTFWLLGGLAFALPLAVCVIVLAFRYPGEGGLYLWSQKSFGDFAGFVTGWAYWTCILSFLPGVLTFIAGSALYVGPEDYRPGGRHDLSESRAYFITFSLLCLAAVTAFNCVDLGVGKWLHNAGAVGSWLPAIALVAVAFFAWLHSGPATDLPPVDFAPTFGLKEAVLWPVLIMSLTGLEAAPVLGDEIKATRRELAVAVIIGAAVAVLTKVVATLAVLVVLTPAEVNKAGSLAFMQSYESAAHRAGIGGWLSAVAAVVAIGHVGNLGAWSATGARLPFVAGVDRYLPRWFGELNRHGAPYKSVLFQSALVAVLVVVGQAGTTAKGAYDVLISMTLIPTIVPFFFVFAAAIKVQFGPPAPGRMPTRAGRWVTSALAALGLVTAAVAAGLSVIPHQTEQNKPLYVVKVVGLAVLLMGAGALVYVVGSRRAERHLAAVAAVKAAAEAAAAEERGGDGPPLAASSSESVATPGQVVPRSRP
jgi:amino acid transporter